MKNAALLVPSGESGLVDLEGPTPAFVIRGARPGPIVWGWVPSGEHDLSHQQALGELRDRLRPRELSGAVGLLLDGPPPPLDNEQYPYRQLCRAISVDTTAIVLAMCLPSGCEAMPHVALDIRDAKARKVARDLGARFLVPPILCPRLHPGLLTAPTVMWIDGESERMTRQVIDRASRAFELLLLRLGMLTGIRARQEGRVILKQVSTVEAKSGVVEAAVRPGELVHKGQIVAYEGEPGLSARQPLLASATGVTLFVRSGRQIGGAVVGIGRLRRTLESVKAHAPPSIGPSSGPAVGWCERVGLPDLGVPELKAKIDTGARTSALHVSRMVPIPSLSKAGRERLRIYIPTPTRTVKALVEVLEHKLVRDSGGHAEKRPIIETRLRLGSIDRLIRISLTFRGDMVFPMLVGRTALPPDTRIHPGRRWLLG